MTDLRKAAEDMLETLDKPFTASKTIFQAKEALRQALAQTEQEPVGTYGQVAERMYELMRGTIQQMEVYDHFKNIPLYTAPPSIEDAVLAEREAIMKICNRHNHPIAGVIYHAIRARSEK